MQVRELVDLGRFLQEFIQEKRLPELYTQLVTAINAANESPEAVGTTLDELLALHAEAEERVLSPAQSKLMDEFGAEGLLGNVAAERLKGVFGEHHGHPQGLVAAIHEVQSETSVLVERANEMVAFLEPMLVELDEGEIGEDEGRLWLYFAEAASVETIEDLERAAETWKQILHHFSRMPGGEARAGRILQLHKYSPLEIELVAHAAVLLPIALGVQWVLSRIEQVIRIRQEAETLKHLKVKSSIIEALQQDAEDKRHEIASEAADQLQERFKADSEARNAAELALKSIIQFIEGGGELDIDVPTSDQAEGDDDEGEKEREEPDRVELRQLIRSIREGIKLLPPSTGSTESETP